MNATTRQAKAAERKASVERMAAAKAATRSVVATGHCPQCGAPLRRNWALTGWWQCSQFGADGFRADSSKPSCDWQGFTE